MQLLHSKFIQNWFRLNFDIIFISETHLTKGQIFEIPDFVVRHNPYSTVEDTKARGGVSCFVVPHYLCHIKEIVCDIPENIMINFKNGDSVFGTYIPPSDSRFFEATDFSNIANVFVPINQDRIILGGGDMNGRVGDVKYTLPAGYMSYLPNIDGIENEHGKEIIKICRTFKAFIVNNMKFKEKIFRSYFTYQKGEKKSQNDLILANMAALEAINDFTVHDIMWNPSDHKPISVSFELKLRKGEFGVAASTDISDDSLYDRIAKAKKISSPHVNWDGYYNLIETDVSSYETKVDQLKEHKSLDTLDSVVTALSNSLYNSAKVNTVKPKLQTSPPCSGGIFDDIDDLCVRQQAADGNAEWDELRKEAVAHIQNDVSITEHTSWSNVLKSKDSKELWNKINWNGTFAKTDESEKPNLQDLASHFSEKGQAGRDSTVLCDVTGSTYVHTLDEDISIEEIKSAQKNLKEDKSTSDGWAKKMVTNVPVAILLLLQLIYNTILKFHIFPTAWRMTVINEIFKNKGSRSWAKSYRPISLVQLLAKLFDFILLGRFKKWFHPDDGQTAYQEKKGCADHVFLLRCMAQHAKKFNKKLFMIAIDFDGAFDRVCRSLLVRKLCLFGAGTVFVACLASIYMSTDNIIFRESAHVTYKLFSGIKQGLPLSPLLFLFYINDVFDYLGHLYDNGKCTLDVLHILIHADDATILARDRNTAIDKLKSMLDYCNLNHIICQFSKCEFLVVNGECGDDEPLPFGNETLRNVDHILLLGSHLTSIASVKEELALHMTKRYKSVVKFYNFLRSNRIAPVKVKLKVLKSCVSSLLHNCETFGDYLPKDLETTYHKLLKSCLNVRLNTSNDNTLIETGFLPIKAVILMRQYKFYMRFKDNIKKQSRREKMLNLLLQNRTDFLHHYEQLISKYSSAQDIAKEFRTKTKNKVYDLARRGKTKYSTYVEMNPDLSHSPLLDVVHPVASDMIKFRLGSHYLPVETGRWCGLEHGLRLCGSCGEIGDEKHVLYRCLLIDRSDVELQEISQIWCQPEAYKIFKRIKDVKLL